MNKNIKNFMQNEIPGKRIKINILSNKIEEMNALRNEGYTLQQIVDFLKKTYKIKTSRQTVSKILKEE
jgi:transposase